MSANGGILVVDDEPANVRLLGRLLSAEGYAVRVATSGEDALAQIDQRLPDLVLLDVVLPGLSGYEVCERLRARPDTRLLPVILVTGSRPEQERVQGLDAGADEFLTKPVNREEMLARVRALLRVGALHREVEDWGRTLEARVREQVEQLERFNRLKNFLPQKVAELVTGEGGATLLEPRRRQVAVCVIDIRGFTAFSEAARPEQVVEMLREYFAAMGQIVERHGGTVERFVGDGMVTFFNAPLEIAQFEIAAVNAAIEMRSAFDPLRERWAARGHTLGLGIGISSGMATVGAIGFAHRWQYAATGTVTNVSARLCSEAAHGQILVTPRVLKRGVDRFFTESLGEMSLRGLQHALPVYNVLGRVGTVVEPVLGRCHSPGDDEPHPRGTHAMSNAPPPETTVLGACPHDCPDTCSMLFKVREGRVVAVQGNASHPFTQGRLCAKTNHYQERIYHPERVLHPLRRVGAKGEGRFERISWDEALAWIGERWRSIIAQSGPTAILPYSYLGTQGLVNGLTVGDAFFNRLGATVSERTFCDSGASTAYVMTVGPTPGMDPESLEHSRFIILWACNLLSTNAHLWPFVERARAQGAKLVVIDPVRTQTASSADQHIRVRPGTDGALALAMIHVIVNEGLVDRDYVEQHTVGYAELAEHVARYTPEFAAAETGVDPTVIRQLARDYATTQPSAIRIGVAIERSAGGGQLVRALACLPALAGAWRRPGGGLLQLPLWAFPVRWDRLHRADLIPPGTRVLNQWRIGAALTGELALDPPIRSLFVYNSNPLVVAPDQLRLKRGLAREDLFTVVSDHFLTDTARYADLVLPATTQAEQHDLMFSWGHLYLTLNRPAIAPIGEAVSNAELFRRLARVMGFDEDPFFQRGDEQILRESVDWDHPTMQGITMERLESQGYARLNLPPAAEFAPHAQGAFPTPSGKVELKASMAAGGNFVLPTFRQGSNEHQDGSPVPALPSYRAPRESAGEAPALAARYPLAMMSPKSHSFLNSTYANHRRQLSREGEQKVFMHASDAQRRGIRADDLVRVHNDRGSFVGVAKIGEETMPGVIIAPMGHWVASSRAEATPAAINPTAFADLGCAPSFSDNLVEVSRV